MQPYYCRFSFHILVNVQLSYFTSEVFLSLFHNFHNFFIPQPLLLITFIFIEQQQFLF